MLCIARVVFHGMMFVYLCSAQTTCRVEHFFLLSSESHSENPFTKEKNAVNPISILSVTQTNYYLDSYALL